MSEKVKAIESLGALTLLTPHGAKCFVLSSGVKCFTTGKGDHICLSKTVETGPYRFVFTKTDTSLSMLLVHRKPSYFWSGWTVDLTLTIDQESGLCFCTSSEGDTTRLDEVNNFLSCYIDSNGKFFVKLLPTLNWNFEGVPPEISKFF